MAYYPATMFVPQFFSDTGVPLAGGSIAAYIHDTITPTNMYTDSAGTSAGSVITLNARGEPAVSGNTVVIHLDTSIEYKFVLKNASGATIWTINDLAQTQSQIDGQSPSEFFVSKGLRVVDSIAALKALDKTEFTRSLVTGYYSAGDGGGGNYWCDSSDTTSADNGGSIIVASDGARWKLLYNGKIHVNQFGAKGDGTADDTATLNACYLACSGCEINHGEGNTYIVSATLNMRSGSKYKGRSIIQAAASAAISGAVMLGTSVSSVKVFDLEVDGNADNNGANYGIWFVGGSNNFVDDTVEVHDTLQAGCVAQSEDGTSIYGLYNDCGRVGGTDNHGVMVYSIGATPLKNIIVRARVRNAYRKGIAVYSDTPGTIENVKISLCDVTGCGLGGIYVANAPTGIIQNSIILEGNTCADNYVNYQIANAQNVTGSGNISKNSSGAHGVIIQDSTDCQLGFIDDGAATGGIRVYGCQRVKLIAPIVRNCNQTAAGFGAGVEFLDSTDCDLISPEISKTTGSMTHGFIESGTSNNNRIDVCGISGASAVNVTAIGANTYLHGSMSNKSTALALSNGANQDVSVLAESGILVSSAPTAIYSIGGIAGGRDGRRITLNNNTAYTMTLNHQDAGSAAANRFKLRSSANIAVLSNECVELVYSATVGCWIAIA